MRTEDELRAALSTHLDEPVGLSAGRTAVQTRVRRHRVATAAAGALAAVVLTAGLAAVVRDTRSGSVKVGPADEKGARALQAEACLKAGYQEVVGHFTMPTRRFAVVVPRDRRAFVVTVAPRAGTECGEPVAETPADLPTGRTVLASGGDGHLIRAMGVVEKGASVQVETRTHPPMDAELFETRSAYGADVYVSFGFPAFAHSDARMPGGAADVPEVVTSVVARRGEREIGRHDLSPQFRCPAQPGGVRPEAAFDVEREEQIPDIVRMFMQSAPSRAASEVRENRRFTWDGRNGLIFDYFEDGQFVAEASVLHEGGTRWKFELVLSCEPRD